MSKQTITLYFSIIYEDIPPIRDVWVHVPRVGDDVTLDVSLDGQTPRHTGRVLSVHWVKGGAEALITLSR